MIKTDNGERASRCGWVQRVSCRERSRSLEKGSAISDQPLLTPQQVAQRLQISPLTVVDYLRKYRIEFRHRMITMRGGYAKNGDARSVPMNQLLTDILKSVKLAHYQGE